MQDQLLERDDELATFDARLTATRRGEGGAVVVESAAGTGKTALLRRLRAQARDAGFEVLPAVGGELDREFPFGLVRQLFEPPLLGTAPAERDRLLSGAAAHAAPIVGGGAVPLEPSADASFAVLHGLYWLTAALAESAPLLLVVDDAHWGDAPSLRFLEFLARRAAELRVLVAVGTRPNEPGAEQALLGALATGPSADVVRPSALTPDAVRALVLAEFAEVADGVVDGAVRSTGGNPLLVRELVRELATADAPPTARAVADAVPSSVARAADRRLERLDVPTQAVARALAVLGDGTPTTLLASATDRPERAVAAALDVLRGADLVEDDPPRFAHPLLRSAVAAGVASTAIADLHHAAARALYAAGATEGALVVHLLAAPPLGEPWAAASLRESARRAAASGAPDAGLRQLLRAREELGLGADDLPAVDLELAKLAASSGDPRAGTFLEQAMRSGDERTRAEAGVVGVSNALIQQDERIDEVVRLVRGRLAELPPDQHEEQARLTTALMSALTMMPHHREQRHELLGDLAGAEDFRLRAYHCWDLLTSGADAQTVAAVARRSLAGRPMQVLEHVEHPIPLWAIEALIHCDDAVPGDEALQDGERTARRAGSRHGAAMVQMGRAGWCVAFGSLATAEAQASEARARFTELGIELTAMAPWRAHGEALIERGRLDEADELLRTIPGHDVQPAAFGVANLWVTRAHLRLQQGRPDEAWSDLEAARGWLADFGWARWARGFIEPLQCRAMIDRGDADGVAWGVAEAARAQRGGYLRLRAELLLAAAGGVTGTEAQGLLEDAAAAADAVPAPLTQAKVAFARGTLLRRAGQRVEAREQLVRARALAGAVEANGLADRAAEELVIAGGRPRRVATSGADALTPSERRVAEHAARGLSNREIAEALFVTRKTVETTLGHAYAKLRIRSRTQLAAALEPAA